MDGPGSAVAGPLIISLILKIMLTKDRKVSKIHWNNKNMIFRYFLGAIVTFLFVSCSSELDSALKGCNDEFVPLKISVTDEPLSKVTGQNLGPSLSDGAEIGVFVTASDGSLYDGKVYDNILFTANGTGENQTWSVDENTPILLSSTKGKVFAYYPRQESGASLNSITISNDGNDWMYTPSASSEVYIANPSAQLCMEHAMTIIRVNIVAGNEITSGTVSRLALNGDCWATSATLDLQNGTIDSYVGKGEELTATDLGSLSSSPLSQDFWVVSNKTSSRIAFTLGVGSDQFIVHTPTDVTLERGKVYNYTLSVENLKEITLSSVYVTDWTSEADLSVDEEYAKWANYANGVYAIDNLGELVDYATAIEAPSGTYEGVAVVMRGKAFEIAKVEAAYSTQWNEYQPFTEIQREVLSPYYIKYGFGVVKRPDGTYDDSSSDMPPISDDISTWTTGGTADLDGKANTRRILQAGVTIASAVTAFNQGSNNQGSSAWYIPAEGQLAYIYMNHDKVNDLMGKVGGDPMSTTISYWSSTVLSYSTAWIVGFDRGSVGTNTVTKWYPVRLVQDL